MISSKAALIEDNDALRSLICTLLEMEGYTVISFKTYGPEEETLQELSYQKPDLLIIDVHIHGKESYSFIQKLKSRVDYKGIKILLSSSTPLEGEVMTKGADGFRIKPYMPEDLIKQIHNLLESV